MNNQKGSRIFNRLKAISHKQKGCNLPWLTYELVTSLVQCCCPLCLCFHIYIYVDFLLLLSRLTGHLCFFLSIFDFLTFQFDFCLTLTFPVDFFLTFFDFFLNLKVFYNHCAHPAGLCSRMGDCIKMFSAPRRDCRVARDASCNTSTA